MQRWDQVMVGCLLAMTLGTKVLAASHVEGGDAAKGEQLAREACARCHDVEANGRFKQDPPSFAAIAVYRSKEQIFGRVMYPPLHTGMPNLGYRLSPENVRDLIAYMASLESR